MTLTEFLKGLGAAMWQGFYEAVLSWWYLLTFRWGKAWRILWR